MYIKLDRILDNFAKVKSKNLPEYILLGYHNTELEKIKQGDKLLFLEYGS